MTRINLVHPSIIIDSQLRGEYKELTRPFNKVIKRIKKYGVENALQGVTIPERYVLGTGHETFFFDKLEWLAKRYLLVYRELHLRGFNINHEKFQIILTDFEQTLRKTPYWNDYTPTPEEIYLNMARLCIMSKDEKVLTELKRGLL